MSDRAAHRIRKLSPTGMVSIYAGTGVRGSANGPALSAQFSNPTGLALDAAGNLYVLDSSNPRVRRIDAAGNVTSLAGTGTAGFADGPAAQAQFNIPYGLCLSVDERELYILDAGNHRIRRLTLQPLAAAPATPRPVLSIYPNPATGEVQLTSSLPAALPASLVLLDAVGRSVALPTAARRPTDTGWEWRFDVSTLPAGLYLCRVASSSFTLTQRLLVTR